MICSESVHHLFSGQALAQQALDYPQATQLIDLTSSWTAVDTRPVNGQLACGLVSKQRISFLVHSTWIRLRSAMDEESRMKGNPPHESDEDESDDEEDYCEVFFFTNCHDVPDEKTEFGNDYFTRNGIPVPDLPAAKHPKCPTDVPKNDAKEFQQYKTQTWEETGSENQEMGELELEEQDMSENRDSDNEDSHEEDFDYVNYVENHDRDRELSFPPEIDMDESKNEERLESPFKFLDEHSFSKGCEYCGKRFTSKSGYMVHTSCYTRRLAAKLAKKQKNVTGHISQDQDQLFECLECDKKFKGKDCLAMHAYCHFEPRFVCKVCPYKTGYIATAKRHELKHARKMATGVSLLNGPPVLKIKSSVPAFPR